MNPFQVLIVEDDIELREIISEALAPVAQVLSANDGEQCLRVAQEKNPQLIILDINLPLKDGMWACEHLRTQDSTKNIPIIVVSGRSAIEDKLRLYKLGADDFLEKPFNLLELKAKVESRRLRFLESRPQMLHCGNLTLNTDSKKAFVDSEEIRFSYLEAELLCLFLRHQNKILTREKIMTEVWKNTAVSGRTVDVHMVGLRKKLANFDHQIQTIHGAGYLLHLKPAEAVKNNA